MKTVNKYIILLLLAVILLPFTSCQPDPEVGGTKVQELAGDWWVKIYYQEEDNGPWEEFDPGYYRFSTYNTATDDGKEIIVTDNETVWGDLKVKVPCDPKTLTFGSPDEVISILDDEVTYIVSEGQIFPKGTTTASKTVTDSIDFKINDFYYTEMYGIKLRVAGYRHTGWEEDIH